MAETRVFFYREKDGSIPLVSWLDDLPTKIRAKCIVRVQRLAEMGHELRRPEADFLRDGIYELRASYQGMNYRILYFFSGQAAVVLSHGLIKKQEVPFKEIDRAIERKKRVESSFDQYTIRAGF